MYKLLYDVRYISLHTFIIENYVKVGDLHLLICI